MPATASTYRRVSVAIPTAAQKVQQDSLGGQQSAGGPFDRAHARAFVYPSAVFRPRQPAGPRIDVGQRGRHTRQPRDHARLPCHDGRPAHRVLSHQGRGGPIAPRAKVLLDRQAIIASQSRRNRSSQSSLVELLGHNRKLRAARGALRRRRKDRGLQLAGLPGPHRRGSRGYHPAPATYRIP